jgi:hypothetical protein
LVVGVLTGVSAFIFLRSEEWVVAAVLGGVALLSFILAAAAHQRASGSAPSEDGVPVEDGTPRASSTPPPASTA